LALPIVAALYAALPTTSYAQGWVWRAGKWVYEVAKDSKALTPGVSAGAGAALGTFIGRNAQATEADRCLADELCRQSLGLSSRPRSTSGMATPEEHERFFQRFNAPPPGSATHRLLKQN
jgi:hypothetical protein